MADEQAPIILSHLLCNIFLLWTPYIFLQNNGTRVMSFCFVLSKQTTSIQRKPEVRLEYVNIQMNLTTQNASVRPSFKKKKKLQAHF